MADTSRIEELKRRVRLDPASIAFAALAEEYRRAGAYEDAVETCLAGLQRHPAYLSARVTLGRALIELGRYDEAREHLEQVLRTAPENLAAIRGLAAIHHRGNEMPESVDHDTADAEPGAPAESAPDGARPIPETPPTESASPVASHSPIESATPVQSHAPAGPPADGSQPPETIPAPLPPRIPVRLSKMDPVEIETSGPLAAPEPAIENTIPQEHATLRKDPIEDDQPAGQPIPPDEPMVPEQPAATEQTALPEQTSPLIEATPGAAPDIDLHSYLDLLPAAVGEPTNAAEMPALPEPEPPGPEQVQFAAPMSCRPRHPDESALPELEALHKALVRARGPAGETPASSR